MADDIDITPGSGKKVATDEVGVRHFQLIKPAFGSDGSAQMVDDSHGLPVAVVGTPAVSVAGVSTADKQDAANAALGAPADAESASGDGSIVALLKNLRTRLASIDAELAGTLGVVGTVAVGNFPATQAVSAAALPLPAGASTEATLAALNAKFAALSSGRVPTVDAAYDAVFGKMLVGTARDKFRDEFATFDTANNWEVVQTGAGMTVTVAGAANGARYLNVATGTTINSETIIQSRTTFKLPVKLACALSMSQRIANQEAFVELVGVDGAGAVETDTSIAASANLNNATNAASLKWDGTTAANALSIVRGYGISELAQASSAYVTTVATGTGPNFIPAGIFEINADMEEVVFGARNIDSLAALTGVNKRTQYICDPTKDYKVRIRVRNLGTAPASTTDVRIHNIRVLDTTRFTVDWARHMGRTSDIADSLPVALTTPTTLPVSMATNTPTLAVGTNLAADVGLQVRANATGAASTLNYASPATPAGGTIKGSAGRLLGYQLTNTAAALRWVKLFNQTAVTMGTTSAAYEFPIAAGATVALQLPAGIAHTTGIMVAVTTARGLTDNTAGGALGDVAGTFFFA